MAKMDLFEKYELTKVINACGKMTHLSGAIVHPEIAAIAAESLKHFFILDEIQAAAGRVIAATTGAESGCVTACTAAGITLGVAACMTGRDLAKVWQLPNAEGMARRVLIQKGHCVNYGNPITQTIPTDCPPRRCHSRKVKREFRVLLRSAPRNSPLADSCADRTAC